MICFEDSSTEECFGGDARTQLLGLTLCALAHELGGTRSINLFMKYLAPILIAKSADGETDGILEAFHLLLTDNCERILNEGAARGLTGMFSQAIERTSLPIVFYSRNKPFANYDEDYHLVGGLLLWLASRREGAYLTRSALTARVATCLKRIGYTVGDIRAWDGCGSEPATTGGVILVVGGRVATDSLILDEQPDNS